MMNIETGMLVRVTATPEELEDIFAPRELHDRYVRVKNPLEGTDHQAFFVDISELNPDLTLKLPSSHWALRVDMMLPVVGVIKKERPARLSPQANTVLRHLIDHGDITPLKARHVHQVESLSARISELRKAGYGIKAEWRVAPNGKRYREYFLNSKRAAA